MTLVASVKRGFTNVTLFVLLLYCIFQIPDKITTVQATVCRGMEWLCVILRRLSYSCKFCDMVWVFGKSIPELFQISNAMVDLMLKTHALQALREKCPNTEFFLVGIFLYSDGMRKFTFWFIFSTIRTEYGDLLK